MTYDDDIRWMVRIVRMLVLLNLALMARALVDHSWLNALCALIWALNCRVWLSSFKVQQRTRDAGRVVESAVRGILEETE